MRSKISGKGRVDQIRKLMTTQRGKHVLDNLLKRAGGARDEPCNFRDEPFEFKNYDQDKLLVAEAASILSPEDYQEMADFCCSTIDVAASACIGLPGSDGERRYVQFNVECRQGSRPGALSIGATEAKAATLDIRDTVLEKVVSAVERELQETLGEKTLVNFALNVQKVKASDPENVEFCPDVPLHQDPKDFGGDVVFVFVVRGDGVLLAKIAPDTYEVPLAAGGCYALLHPSVNTHGVMNATVDRVAVCMRFWVPRE